MFVENLRPGVADREGYSAQALAERNPGIIYVSVKLNTHEGPWTRWPGYDVSAGGHLRSLHGGRHTGSAAPAAAGQRRLRHHDRLPGRHRRQGRAAAAGQGGRQLFRPSHPYRSACST